MRQLITILFLLPLLAYGQSCDKCIGVPASLTATPVGSGPFTYSWTCSDGSASTSQIHTTNNVANNFSCVVNITDVNGCVAMNTYNVNAIQPPILVIQISGCVISWATQNLGTNTCSSYVLQRQLAGGSWVTASTSLPFTATVNGNYRVAYTCTCGTYYSNTVVASGCTPCTPFTIADFGDCDLVILGTVPCGSSNGPFQVWQSVNNSINCTDPNACVGAAYTLYTTTSNVFVFINNDGCYYMTTTCNGVTYCSNVVCMDDDCNVGCTGAIAISQTGCTLNVTYPGCTVTSWKLQYYNTNTATWTNYSTGTTSPPTSFSIPYSGQWRVNINCSNGCTYTSAVATFTGCGTQPCGTSTTVSIVQNPDPCVGTTATLTAVVSNCGVSPFTPSYVWSNGATTQAITVSAGTYSVTVTGCCTTPVTASKTFSCSNPCGSYDVNITGATTLCTSASTTLSSSITGGTSPYTYLWKINGVNSGTGSSLTVNGASYSPGLITITLTVTDANGCTDIDTHNIEILNCTAPCDCTPTLTFNSGTCTLTMNMTGTGCAGYNEYALLKWNGSSCNSGNTTVATGLTSAFPATYSVSQNTGYQLVITGTGCTTKITNCVTTTGCCADCDGFKYSSVDLGPMIPQTGAELDLFWFSCDESNQVDSGTIDWGDGSSDYTMTAGVSEYPVSHSYGSTGSFKIDLDATMDYGGTVQTQGMAYPDGSDTFAFIILRPSCGESSGGLVISDNGCTYDVEFYFVYSVRFEAWNDVTVSSYTFTVDGTPVTLGTHDPPTSSNPNGYIYGGPFTFNNPTSSDVVPYVLTCNLSSGHTIVSQGNLHITCP